MGSKKWKYQGGLPGINYALNLTAQLNVPQKPSVTMELLSMLYNEPMN